MIGDRLIIKEEHARAARQIVTVLVPRLRETRSPFIVTIAGESGAGKSEIASSLARHLDEQGFRSIILQQDDYFVYPPKTNARMRAKDIRHVGPGEVRLDVMAENITAVLRGDPEIEKPLVVYEEDRVTSETLSLSGISVVIVEGTYTTLLNQAHCHVFIERDYRDTRESRQERAREAQDAYLEKILEIEHEIISGHKRMADILVTRDYRVEKK